MGGEVESERVRERARASERESARARERERESALKYTPVRTHARAGATKCLENQEEHQDHCTTTPLVCAPVYFEKYF